jgi:hypothetical protein
MHMCMCKIATLGESHRGGWWCIFSLNQLLSLYFLFVNLSCFFLLLCLCLIIIIIIICSLHSCSFNSLPLCISAHPRRFNACKNVSYALQTDMLHPCSEARCVCVCVCVGGGGSCGFAKKALVIVCQHLRVVIFVMLWRTHLVCAREVFILA